MVFFRPPWPVCFERWGGVRNGVVFWWALFSTWQESIAPYSCHVSLTTFWHTPHHPMTSFSTFSPKDLLKLLKQLRGGVNQLLLSLNNNKSIKTLLIFIQVIINSIQHMDSKIKEHQSHIRYTQRQIFHEETHKGRKPLLLQNDRQSFKFCTSSIIEHQLNVRLLPLFYKLQLVWENQLSGFSSTH